MGTPESLYRPPEVQLTEQIEELKRRLANYEANDFGGAGFWNNWTPASYDSFTPGAATITGAYALAGQTVFFTLKIVLSGSTVGAAPVTFKLPINPAAFYTVYQPIGIATHLKTSAPAAAYPGILVCGVDPTECLIRYVTSAGSSADIATAAPFTWGNNDAMYFSGQYYK